MAKILVVDDEKSICEFLEIFLVKQGHVVLTSTEGLKAIGLLKEENFDLLITDLKMPDISGLDLLEKAKNIDPNIIVILITAFASTESAVIAMKKGAYDYVIKPFKLDEILLVINNALEKVHLLSENKLLKSILNDTYSFRNIIGKSKKMREIFGTIEKLKNSKINVLITGDSGTGKELIAKAIHFNSESDNKPFVAINCAAIPETLLESELFGYMKGAFTGAVQNKKGLFELGNEGTIFLDEIGEISPGIQAKLLRVIQEKNIRKVGGLQDIKIDVRIIAATNKNLEEEVKNKKFREDLYYRLKVIHIQLPSLRERKEDIPYLISHFLEKYSKQFNKKIESISNEALEILMNYEYQGNIRELENIIESTIAIAGENIIEVDALPAFMKNKNTKQRFCIEENTDSIDLDSELNKLEKEIIMIALKQTEGDKQKAAEYLKISLRSLRYRLEKLEINH